MNHRDNKDKTLPQELSRIKMISHSNERSIPIKQTNIHRSCLKHRPKQQQVDIPPDNGETGRLSTGRVSFAHPSLNDGKIPVQSQSQIDLVEKKRRSATFAKKAKELQLAELTYFKDHARDKEPIDE